MLQMRKVILVKKKKKSMNLLQERERVFLSKKQRVGACETRPGLGAVLSDV